MAIELGEGLKSAAYLPQLLRQKVQNLKDHNRNKGTYPEVLMKLPGQQQVKGLLTVFRKTRNGIYFNLVTGIKNGDEEIIAGLVSKGKFILTETKEKLSPDRFEEIREELISNHLLRLERQQPSN